MAVQADGVPAASIALDRVLDRSPGDTAPGVTGALPADPTGGTR